MSVLEIELAAIEAAMSVSLGLEPDMTLRAENPVVWDTEYNTFQQYLSPGFEWNPV